MHKTKKSFIQLVKEETGLRSAFKCMKKLKYFTFEGAISVLGGRKSAVIYTRYSGGSTQQIAFGTKGGYFKIFIH